VTLHKYARTEIERRFLLDGVPDGAEVLKTVDIDDRYLDGARLRLRRQAERGGSTIVKLTQKLPRPGPHGLQGEITTIYVSEVEFASLDDAAAFRPAAFCRAEVTGDRRFTGGALARAARDDVAAWAAEYGVALGATP
jgi:CYTH domain-containing protein